MSRRSSDHADNDDQPEKWGRKIHIRKTRRQCIRYNSAFDAHHVHTVAAGPVSPPATHPRWTRRSVWSAAIEAGETDGHGRGEVRVDIGERGPHDPVELRF